MSLLPLKVTTKFKGTKKEFSTGTVFIPGLRPTKVSKKKDGLRPTKVSKKKDGSTTFATASAVSSAAKNVAKKLGFSGVDLVTSSKTTKKAAKKKVKTSKTTGKKTSSKKKTTSRK
jgi:hypothetical protein